MFRLEIVIISTNKKSTRIMYVCSIMFVVICLAKKRKSRKIGTLILLISLIRKIEAPKKKKNSFKKFNDIIFSAIIV